jgi:hypothetical protein
MAAGGITRRHALEALVATISVPSGCRGGSESAAPADHTWAQSMKRLDGIVERCIARFNERQGVA